MWDPPADLIEYRIRYETIFSNVFLFLMECNVSATRASLSSKEWKQVQFNIYTSCFFFNDLYKKKVSTNIIMDTKTLMEKTKLNI